MRNALSITNSGLPARTPGTAIKKAAKKAAKKAVGHHHPKKHAGPGHEHDPEADLRRAYLHLSRASSFLAVIPKSDALGELRKFYSMCEQFGETKGFPPKALAESARALEHLCVVGLAASHSSSGHAIPKELHRSFGHHFQHDCEKQVERLERAEATAEEKSPANALLDLARHSLATAEKMLGKENWYLAHECLRATDALTKAIDQI